MTIEVLVCRPDGTQVKELKQLPDNWFAVPEEEQEPPAEETAE